MFFRKHWMETYSGVQYYPANPRARDVRIRDIAHHLSMLCRYTGAVKRFYSVAEHSVHVSYMVPPEDALAGLLHDAPEAYVSDLNWPLKQSWLIWGHRIIERRNWRVIAQKFMLPEALPPSVHEADMAILHAERAALMPRTGTKWHGADAVATRAAVIMCWTPEQAEHEFMRRFYEVGRGAVYTFPSRPVVPRVDAVFV